MRKMISIITLCLVAGLTMSSPVAASTVQPCVQTSDNVNISQSGLSDANLCLNYNALLLNGVYVNGSCMKLQPKCNSAVVNTYILQQISNNNAFCNNNKQQQNANPQTLAAAAVKATPSRSTTACPYVNASTKAVANVQTATKEYVATVVNTAANPQSFTCPKASIQTTSCPKTTAVTKETQAKQSTKTTTSTEPATTSTQPATSVTTPANNSGNTASTSSFRAFQKQVIDLVNKERASAGLSALAENNDLNNVATLKSEDMVKLNYFSHTSPTYGSPFDMMTQFNIHYTAAGENIAYGQSTPEEVMNGWMNSAGHRANILNTNFTQIGVGIAQKANGQYVWTQEFSRP